ncbi:MAG: LysM peptidoglycan-binding domain-containing protein, partial [Anaerolineales bacterium]
GVHPLPVSEMRTCGDNLVEVVAVDAAGNEAMDLSAFPIYFGDLTITSVEAVQVVYGAPLVQGKGTAFRARVDSSFDCGLEVDVRLELPDGEWSTAPPITGHHRTDMPLGWRYPESWGPYHIPAGAHGFVIMLPLIPPGEEDMPFHASAAPYGIIRNVASWGIFGPDVRVVPRPIADRVSFAIEIDPQDNWPEIDEENNRLTSPLIEAVATKAWRFLFVPTKTFPLPLSHIVQVGETLDILARRNGVTVEEIENYNAEFAEPIGAGLASGDRILIPRPACAPELSLSHAAARRHMEYLLATFPIADSKLSWSFPVLETEPCDGGTCGYATTWQQDPNIEGEWEYECSVYGRIAAQALEDHDFGIVQACSGGQSCQGYGILVGADGGDPLLAHEFNHSIVPMRDIYSLDCYVSWDERYCELPSGERFYCCYDCYDEEKERKEADGASPGLGCTIDCGASPNDCSSVSAGCPTAASCPDCCRTLCQTTCDARGGTIFDGPDGRTQANMPAGEGFWVNRWMPIAGRTYFMDGPSGNNWMILESAAAIGALDGRDPGCGMHGADADGFINMIEKFRSPTDPAALLVSGLVNRATGTVVLNPFIKLPQAVLDIEPGSEGDYAFVLLGPSGEILSQSGFSPSFYRSDPAGGPTDEVHFAFRIEWVDGTTRIEVRDEHGIVLATRTVTPNQPQLTLTTPNGGEVWKQGSSYTVRWEADDADGDELTYTLALSTDAGVTWTSIGFNLIETQYKVDTSTLAEGSKYLLRVRATDGVNSTEDVSDDVFAISTEAAPPASNLILVGLIIMGLLGMVALIGAVVMFIRNRAA